MATDIYSGNTILTDDATFRAWGLAFSDALTRVGLPKSADTGQIDWETVTRPSANAMAGYEIRYLNDSLHGTKPYYIKIEFGINYAGQSPLMYFTTSSSTNGAGTSSGTTYLARINVGGNSLSYAGNYPTFCSIDEGYFATLPWRRANATASLVFIVCRTTDATGAPTTDGFYTYYSDGGSLYRYTYIDSLVYDNNKYCLFPGAILTTNVDDDNILTFKHFGFSSNYVVRPIPFVLSYMDRDIGNETIFTSIPIIGQPERNYLSFGTPGGPTAVGAGAPVNVRLAIQWQ